MVTPVNGQEKTAARAKSKSAAVKALSKGLALEVHGREHHVVRYVDSQVSQALTLPGLRCRMIDLEYPGSVEKFGPAVRERVEPRPEDDEACGRIS
jgi:hypothetical protein